MTSSGISPYWLWVFIIGGSILVGVVYAVLEARRDKAYLAFCQSRGFTYRPPASDDVTAYASFVGLFRKGNRAWANHAISGNFNGHPFLTYEYVYTTGGGKTTVMYFFALMHWQQAGAALPQFSLGPKSLFDGAVIPFPEDPQFADSCHVTGTDEAAVRALFTAELRAALTPNRGQHLAGKGADLFWWKQGNLPDADEFDAYLSELERIRSLVFTDRSSTLAA